MICTKVYVFWKSASQISRHWEEEMNFCVYYIDRTFLMNVNYEHGTVCRQKMALSVSVEVRLGRQRDLLSSSEASTGFYLTSQELLQLRTDQETFALSPGWRCRNQKS